jgi:biotin transporter BioY
MAFLWSFTGLTVAGFIWMAIFVALDEADDPALNAVAAWLSPMTVTGWLVYALLAVLCSWLTYRLLRRIRS